MTKNFNELYESLWPFSKDKKKFKEIKVELVIIDYDGKEKQTMDIISKPEDSKLSDEEFVKQRFKENGNKYWMPQFGGKKIGKDIKSYKIVPHFSYEKK